MITYKTGNILDCTESTLIHSVNHMGFMSAGLALAIREKYPKVYFDYLGFVNRYPFDFLKRYGVVCFTRVDSGREIASVFGQDKVRMQNRQIDYVALGNGIETVFDIAQEEGSSVAIPYGVGCGLGGGDWNVVKGIIEDCHKYYPLVEVSIYRNDKR